MFCSCVLADKRQRNKKNNSVSGFFFLCICHCHDMKIIHLDWNIRIPSLRKIQFETHMGHEYIFQHLCVRCRFFNTIVSVKHLINHATQSFSLSLLSRVGGRGPSTWVVFCHLPRLIIRELEETKQGYLKTAPWYGTLPSQIVTYCTALNAGL